LCLPISVSEKYVISRPFSDSLPDPFTGEIKKHNGIDIAAVNGSVPVLLPADGEVLLVKEDVFFGKMIRIKHFGGYETFYAHLGSVSVKQGQKLKRGAQIGYFGESGWTTHPHLHYELIKNGENVDPQLYNFNSLYD
jgi:murein DD-endopeptidase MepM/ murein hydrolase activator NlpD